MLLDPSEIAEYSSSRSFHLQDADWSSSAITLHSFGGYHAGDAIDLIFLGTDFVELPFEIKGLRIFQPNNDESLEYEAAFGARRLLQKQEGKRVFKIESAGKRFHVIAAKLWILTRTHNDMKALEFLLTKDEAKRASFIKNHVKEWHKITLYPE